MSFFVSGEDIGFEEQIRLWEIFRFDGNERLIRLAEQIDQILRPTDDIQNEVADGAADHNRQQNDQQSCFTDVVFADEHFEIDWLDGDPSDVYEEYVRKKADQWKVADGEHFHHS